MTDVSKGTGASAGMFWPWSFVPFSPAAGKGDDAAPGASATGNPWTDYLIDGWQRSILFMDLMRQRGNEQEEMTSRPMATVLTFDHEIIMSGRSLPKPINYSLTRIIPPEGTVTDPTKRPVVVVDPRAGQGPGIGGFKTSSEIGDALAHGHSVYFIAFSAEPEPGQSFLDVVEGQVKFLEKIAELHPDASRPFGIGNCQAGYQTLMVAILRPDLFGPIMVAGSPISYWQGVHGENPMRYSGGLLGGSWLTAMVSDLGQGKFDGTWLILNFDNLNPANWIWGKQYDLYSNIDTEAERYLGFEKWWGDFITLNGGEIQYLVDELFIGDKLTRNALQSSTGRVFDLRDVTSPIIVFTSLGDNISPPSQTLGWVLDLYKDVNDLRAHGRTVIYCLNRKVGHLAIFVSSKVGAKEDAEMVRLMDMMDCLPPGLFELVIEEAEEGSGQKWHSRFETRDFDDLRAFGRNSEEDDRAFATVRKVSEMNHSLYNTFLKPVVQATTNPEIARAMFNANPLRLSYTIFADSSPFMKGPFMGGLGKLAEQVREDRRPVGPENPFVKMQNIFSDQVNEALDQFRQVRDDAVEATFFSIYGNSVLQGLMGINDGEKVRGLPPVSQRELAMREHYAAHFIADMDKGGYNEALIRAMLFILAAGNVLDDAYLETMGEARRTLMNLSLDDFKAIVRTQFYILLLDARSGRALDAVTTMVPEEAERAELLQIAVELTSRNGGLTRGMSERITELSERLGVPEPTGTVHQISEKQA